MLFNGTSRNVFFFFSSLLFFSLFFHHIRFADRSFHRVLFYSFSCFMFDGYFVSLEPFSYTMLIWLPFISSFAAAAVSFIKCSSAFACRRPLGSLLSFVRSFIFACFSWFLVNVYDYSMELNAHKVLNIILKEIKKNEGKKNYFLLVIAKQKSASTSCAMHIRKRIWSKNETVTYTRLHLFQSFLSSILYIYVRFLFSSFLSPSLPLCRRFWALFRMDYLLLVCEFPLDALVIRILFFFQVANFLHMPSEDKISNMTITTPCFKRATYNNKHQTNR